MTRFEEIVHDLKEAMELDLWVDRNRACKITFDDNVSVQMQMDEMDEELFFVLPIDDLPPGNYRQRVLMEALRSNSRFDVPGYLTYVRKQGTLLLCDQMAPDEITTEAIVAKLNGLCARSLEWKQAIQTAQPCPADDLRRSGGNTGTTPMFGLQ